MVPKAKIPIQEEGRTQDINEIRYVLSCLNPNPLNPYTPKPREALMRFQQKPEGRQSNY